MKLSTDLQTMKKSSGWCKQEGKILTAFQVVCRISRQSGKLDHCKTTVKKSEAGLKSAKTYQLRECPMLAALTRNTGT